MNDRPSRSQTNPLRLQGGTAPLSSPYYDYLVRVKPEASEPDPETLRQRETLCEAFREQGRHYVALFSKHQEQLSVRIRILSFVLEVYRQPTDQWPHLLQTLRPDHLQLSQLLLQQLSDPGCRQRVSIAVSRYDDAARAVREVAECLLQTEGMAANAAFPLISALSIPKLKGKLYLLSTFGLLFKRDPILNRMFPDPSREAPQQSEQQNLKPVVHPLAPPPRQASEPASPPQGDGFLGKMLRMLKPPPP